MLQGAAALARVLGGERFDGLAKNVLGVGGVLIERGDDGGDGDGVVFGMPAIVIGDHGDGGVAEFGFAGELGFGDVGHADDGKFHGAMIVGFGERGELRAFHADVGSLFVDRNFLGAAGFAENGGELRAGGLVEGDVGDDAIAEEGGFATLGAVEELIGNEEFTGAQIFLEGADGADRDDALDAEKLHGVDIGAEIEFGGENAMAATVTGKKGDALPFQGADDEGVGGIAEGSLDANFAGVGQTAHGIEAAAADDADLGERSFRPRTLALRCFSC